MTTNSKTFNILLVSCTENHALFTNRDLRVLCDETFSKYGHNESIGRLTCFITYMSSRIYHGSNFKVRQGLRGEVVRQVTP